MARSDEITLRDLTEDRFLEEILDGLPVGRNVLAGPGDDCAVVQAAGSRELLLLKTDCVVEGIHYLPEHEPARVGWKALCRALSDVGAMGGEPLHALVTIFTPTTARVAYWKEFYKGLGKAAKKFGVGIVGGETTRAKQAAVAVSLTGRVEAGRLLTRSGGQPGDRLFVTGMLGGSIEGKHLDFTPRVAEGRWLGAHGSVRAMMDLSDGLATDLPRLAAASGCGFEIDPSALPKTRGCDAERALTDGEDYELLMAVPPRHTDRLVRAWKGMFPKLRLTEIGRLTEPGTSSSALPQGFDHFFSCQRTPDKAR
jgi:thiamine-monophosphate kinase